jgi:ankyrin repeat protein
MEYTALHFASEYGVFSIARCLLSNKDICIDSKNNTLSTPLHLACANHHFPIIELLIQKGAKLFKDKVYATRRLF